MAETQNTKKTAGNTDTEHGKWTRTRWLVTQNTDTDKKVETKNTDTMAEARNTDTDTVADNTEHGQHGQYHRKRTQWLVAQKIEFSQQEI